jgi:hypothetical protein
MVQLAWKHLLVRGAPEGIRITVPVPFYLIEHNGEFVLFDTGQQVPEKEFPAEWLIPRAVNISLIRPALTRV